jgi:hypothetical protein
MDSRPLKQVVRNLFGSIKDELNCIKELFHSTLIHWNGQKLTWKHNVLFKKYPQSSMDFKPSKQVVRNLVGNIRDELNCIKKLFHSTLTH